MAKTPELIHRSIYLGRVDRVKKYIMAGGNVELEIGVEGDRRRPIHVAAQCARHEVARLLLNAGANPDAQTTVGDTPLLYAIRRNDVEMVKILIDAGADVDMAGAIKVALATSSLESAAILVKAGAEVRTDTVYHVLSCVESPFNPTYVEDVTEWFKVHAPEAFMDFWIEQGPRKGL